MRILSAICIGILSKLIFLIILARNKLIWITINLFFEQMPQAYINQTKTGH